MGERVALIVAVDDYLHAGLARLVSPASDASSLASVLADEELGGFRVDILHNKNASEIIEGVESILAARQSDDVVLIHFSCHGLKDQGGELYLAAANTRPDRLASTAIDAAMINRLMRRSRARRIALLLDCCYAGAFERGFIPRGPAAVDVGEQFSQDDLGGGRGRVVITASSASSMLLRLALSPSRAPAPVQESLGRHILLMRSSRGSGPAKLTGIKTVEWLSVSYTNMSTIASGASPLGRPQESGNSAP